MSANNRLAAQWPARAVGAEQVLGDRHLRQGAYRCDRAAAGRCLTGGTKRNGPDLARCADDQEVGPAAVSASDGDGKFSSRQYIGPSGSSSTFLSASGVTTKAPWDWAIAVADGSNKPIAKSPNAWMVVCRAVGLCVFCISSCLHCFRALRRDGRSIQLGDLRADD
jgi:hypothetical protein